jgi:hypothetical protein
MRGDYASYNMETVFRKWANRNKALKIFTVGSIREWWNLAVSQLGRIFKGEWI